ncbi:MAG: hypothetical protein R3252_04060 [Robiginitalea sp.]|nr:hypothetical protein [Robiginitalea sp.]
MIRFFRHIRRRLIATGAARKYLLYALGEILLVVLGILIALQVDNWNEARKTRKQLDLLFEDTREFLFPVSTWITPFVERSRTLDSILTLLKKPPGTEYYQEHPGMVHYLFNDSLVFELPSFYWVSPGMKELIEKKTDFPPNYHPLIYDLVTWESNSQDMQELSGDFEAYLESLRQRLIDKAPYLLEGGPGDRQAAIDFVNNSGWYQYELERVGNYTKHMIKALDLLRSSCAELYCQLELTHNNAGATRMDAILQHMELKPLEKLNIPSSENEKPAPGLIPNRGIFIPGNEDVENWWHILINTTPKRITLQVIYNNLIVGQWSPAPNVVARRRLPLGSYIKVIHPDSTASYYQSREGGYLIVE